MTKSYKVLVGLSYPATPADVKLKKSGKPYTNAMAKPGEVVTNIPPESVSWLLEDGRIEEVSDGEVRE